MAQAEITIDLDTFELDAAISELAAYVRRGGLLPAYATEKGALYLMEISPDKETVKLRPSTWLVRFLASVRGDS